MHVCRILLSPTPRVARASMSNGLMDRRSDVDLIPTCSLDAAPSIAPPLGRSRGARASAGMAILTELGVGVLLLGIAAFAGFVFVHRPWPNRLDAWGYRLLPADLSSHWAQGFVTLGSMTVLIAGVLLVFFIGVLRDWVRAIACTTAPVVCSAHRSGNRQASGRPAERSDGRPFVSVGDRCGRGGIGDRAHVGRAGKSPFPSSSTRPHRHCRDSRRGHRVAMALSDRRAWGCCGGRGLGSCNRRTATGSSDHRWNWFGSGSPFSSLTASLNCSRCRRMDRSQKAPVRLPAVVCLAVRRTGQRRGHDSTGPPFVGALYDFVDAT